MSQFVLVETHPTIALVTLNRVERHNALVPEFLRELIAALTALREQPGLRALVLQANGRSFSTGGDVRAFADALDVQTFANDIVGTLNQTILALTQFPMPIVAAVHGIVTGGSLGLVLASDLVFVAPQASFTPYYSVVGFSPDGGWTAMLPAIIGAKRASEIVMLNQTITAEQAVAWGMANRVVAAEEIRAEAFAVAQTIAQKKPASVTRAKRLLWGDAAQLAQKLEAERVQFVEQIGTTEARAGMIGFLKR